MGTHGAVPSWLVHERAPLYEMIFPAEYDFAELDAACSEVEAHFLEVVAQTPHLPVGMLVDASRVTKSTATNRSRIAKALTHVTPVLAEQAVGQAFVMNGPVVRGALTAILWMRRVPWPVNVVATYEEADEWLRAKFADVGVVIPAPRVRSAAT